MTISSPSNRFLMSAEEECLTVVRQVAEADQLGQAIGSFFETMSGLAPSLPGPSGFFNAYGRVYGDSGHIELAASESDSPYALALLLEQQHYLAGQALARLAKRGIRLILANHNHDGLLRPEAATWGTHENYLVEQPPSRFAEQILPFLATRIYAGSGGIDYVTGHFLAGVRSHFMVLDTGGGTTSARALHSTAREEHHMAPQHGCFRYHVICGDGHRSHFSIALQYGATALVLKAVHADPTIHLKVPNVVTSARAPFAWVEVLKRCNPLAAPGSGPRVEPLALEIQRMYLEAAQRYADVTRDLPSWVPQLLVDWDQALSAMARDDRDWLAARLDPWIKYELFSAVLREHGLSWNDVPRNNAVQSDLALLNHDYHEFGNPRSIFIQLEKARALRHRAAKPIIPGTELEPWVPATTTRARARARLVKERRGELGLVVNWADVYDRRTDRIAPLDHPFAESYGEWRPARPLTAPRPISPP